MKQVSLRACLVAAATKHALKLTCFIIQLLSTHTVSHNPNVGRDIDFFSSGLTINSLQQTPAKKTKGVRAYYRASAAEFRPIGRSQSRERKIHHCPHSLSVFGPSHRLG